MATAKLAAESDQDAAEFVTVDWFCLCRVAGSELLNMLKQCNLKLMSMNMHLEIRSLKLLLLQTRSFMMNKKGVSW